MKSGTRLKTSVTLSRATLRTIDQLSGAEKSRSRVIEQAVRAYAAQRTRDARDRRDSAILDEGADALNAELADALEFQSKR